jgi:hypothetical protein
MEAACQCNQLRLEVPSRPLMTIACHCIDCQRRTGSAFGVLAYFRADQVTIIGDVKTFQRISAANNEVETSFCPNCGSTVCLKLSKQPALLGVALGAIADPSFPAPSWSVWEQSKHGWVDVPGDVEHHLQGD